MDGGDEKRNGVVRRSDTMHYSVASQNISQQTSPTQVTWTTQTNLRFTYVNLT